MQDLIADDRRFRWTPEDKAMVGDLWAAGHTAAHIARHLGDKCSRNAVIGIINRSGLMRSARPGNRVQPYPTSRKQRVAIVKRSNVRKSNVRKEAAAAWMADLSADTGNLAALNRMAADPSGTVALIDAEPHHCRHIPHDDSLCCGRSIVPGLPYCEEHARRCLRPAPAVSEVRTHRFGDLKQLTLTRSYVPA